MDGGAAGPTASLLLLEAGGGLSGKQGSAGWGWLGCGPEEGPLQGLLQVRAAPYPPAVPRDRTLTDGVVDVLHGNPQLHQQRLLLHPRGPRLRLAPGALAPPIGSGQELLQVLEGAVLSHLG